MEKTDEKLANLIEKLQDAGFTQAPEIIDGAIRAIHFDGVLAVTGALLFGALFLVSLITLLYGATKDNDVLMGVGAIGSIFCLILTIIIGSARNPWLKMFDPEAALYQQIVKGLLQ